MEPVIKYRLGEDGFTILADGGATAVTRIGRTDHASYFSYVTPEQVFNRGQKRGVSMVISGDQPRVALMRVFPEDRLDPDLFQCGAVRIRVTCGEKAAWLDAFPEIGAAFHAEGTSWQIADPQAFPGLAFAVTLTCAEDWGLVLQVTATNEATAEQQIALAFHYGGMVKWVRTFSAAYRPADDPAPDDNRLTAEGKLALLESDTIPECAGATCLPAVPPMLEGAQAIFRHHLALAAGEQAVVALLAARGDGREAVCARLATADAEALMDEARRYYAGLLQDIAIATPSATLDAAFRWSVVGLDYVYSDPAWLEGVHWWSAYWCNNYQLSGALAIGQGERVERALRFLGMREWGPCANLCASGAPCDLMGKSDTPALELGTPYYVYQLLQYDAHSGDAAFFRGAAPYVDRGLRHLLQVRGGREDGLLSWMRGCNTFLYQADHLGLPGAGASPSIMVSGLAGQFAAALSRYGLEVLAAEWRQIGSDLQAAAVSVLWEGRQGYFLNHRDPQGVAHPAHYYSDLVFPTLYSDLPEHFGLLSLDHLRRTLLLPHPLDTRERPLTLLRVGDLQPALFGNDNVMPTQMAEAARAFCRIGDHETAHALLEAVALASLLQTEAPGSMPERMGLDGKGEGNYLFGNPTGGFLYAVVDGLFGIALMGGGTTMRFQPAMPDAWEHAALTLPYAEMTFARRRAEDGHITDSYRLMHAGGRRALDFAVFLPPCAQVEVTINGAAATGQLSPALNRTRFALAAPPAEAHILELRYHPTAPLMEAPPVAYAGQMINLACSSPITSMEDPQQILELVTRGTQGLQGRIVAAPGPAVIYLQTEYPPCLLPVELDIRPELAVACEGVEADAEAGTLALSLRLEGWLCADGELVTTFEGVISRFPIRAWEGFGGTAVHAALPVETLYEGVRRLEWRLGDSAGRCEVVVRASEQGNLERLIALRRAHTFPIDLAAWKNASALHQFFPWQDSEYQVDLNGLPREDGVASFAKMSFRIDTAGLPMALVTMGVSDPSTWAIKPGLVCTEVTIPVGRRASMLGLCYVSESCCRHTDAAVGSLRLHYTRGEDEVIPLVVGRQLAWLDRPAASSEATPAHGNILLWRTSCDPARELAAFTLRIEVPDAQIGLIAANVVE